MKIIYIIISVFALLLLAACTPLPAGPGEGTYEPTEVFNPDKDVSASSFKSVVELKNFLSSASGSNNYYGGGMRMAAGVDMVMNNAVPMMAESANEVAVQKTNVDFSETNNQVANVDEADIIKTDGEYIYTVTGKTLFIIKAYPGEDAEVVHKIALDSHPLGIFIEGDYLAVFGDYYNNEFFDDVSFSPRAGMTFFDVYDISDKEDPVLEEEYKFEGRYFQARLMDGYVYFVVTSSPDIYREVPTPVVFDGTTMRNVAIEDVHYYHIPYDNPQFATVHALKLSRASEIESKTVTIEYNPEMYMSENNLYIAYSEQINEWELQEDIIMDLLEPLLTSADKALIQKIKDTDNDVLSQAEKKQKIMNVMESYANYMNDDEREALEEKTEKLLAEKLDSYDYMEFTIIHKLVIEDGHIWVRKTGKVPGRLNNQFSMDEYDNVLRVATTVNARWNRMDSKRTESTNHVLTLDDNMNVMDHLKDLAEGERIYSTRFMGEKLYMVTFRQVDPFFVIDLSNPNNIETLGELKIPGFSRYLHPYDENIIIGIGRDATDMGRTQGLKISLFDVSNPANPEEIAKFEAEGRYSSSIAEYEHKAFLFSKEKNLLVIPAYSYDYQGDSYNGAMVFKISKDEISLWALIDHSGTSENRYSPSVERSLYIEDLLYTKSPNLLRINDLEDDLQSVKSITLTEEYAGDMRVIETDTIEVRDMGMLE